MALAGALILLFSGWMLWGWLVSEHRKIVWARNWCAGLFILTAVLISFGAGAGSALVVVKGRHRDQIREFATRLDQQLALGRTSLVQDELRRVTETPDEWSTESEDLLKRFTASIDRLHVDPAAPENSPPKSAKFDGGQPAIRDGQNPRSLNQPIRR